MTTETFEYLDTSVVTCDFCKSRTTLGKAMDAGWDPNYYRIGDEHVPTGGPCCPKCFDRYLAVDENHEVVQTAPACPVQEVDRVRKVNRSYRKGMIDAYEAYNILRELGVSERRALAMLFRGKD